MMNNTDLDDVLVRAAELERKNEALRAHNAELERRFAPPSEAELNRARLLDAARREREEAAARAHAREDEARLRALAKQYAHREWRRDEQRSAVLAAAFVGVIGAGAAGSIAGIAVVILVAGAVLAFIGSPEKTDE